MKLEDWSTDDVQAGLRRGDVTVIDALPAAPFARRHLPSALNLTAEHDDAAIRQALPDQDARLVTYSTDSACTRGPDLAARLVDLGYADVGVYREGIAAWVGAGHPVESADH